MEKAQEWFDYAIELAKEFGPKLVTALIIYLVGMWVVNKIIKGTRKVMSKSKYDQSLQKFLLNLFSWALKVDGAICARRPEPKKLPQKDPKFG